MSAQTNNPGITIKVTSVPIAARRLITVGGVVTGVSTTQDWVGVTQEARAVGEYVPVRMTKAGTVVCTAAGAISAGNVVYKAASGKVGTASTGSIRFGIALEDASGDGVEVNVLPD